MRDRRSLLSIACLLAYTAMQPVDAEQASRPTGNSVDQPVQEQTISRIPPVSHWPSIGPARAAMLCIHGLGLHRGTYGDLAVALANRGISVYAVDVRGFGAWQKEGQSKIDFDAALQDIRLTLDSIKSKQPDLPVFLLGESMGGAIALRAAVENCDKLAGLISSVPSNDRFGGLGNDLHIPLRVLTGGFKERFDVGSHVIKYATQKPDLAELWKNDPQGRNNFSPLELLHFQSLMKKNFEMAGKLKNVPILVVQGARDKLVRPSGTWDVWDHISGSDVDIVLSANAEHLIFEYGQFSADDLAYLCNWLDKRLIKQSPADGKPALSGSTERARPDPAGADIVPAAADVVPAATGSAGNAKISIAYWIELLRDGKRWRCNNKTAFRSGDEIRLHVRSNTDGYAYILLKAGSTGKQAVLFPDERTGRFNRVAAFKDIALPAKSFLRFDDNPGQELISIIFSQKPLDAAVQKTPLMTAFVSPDSSGAKDLVPTRMELSWADPNPVMMPGAFREQAGLAISQPGQGGVLENMVKVSLSNPEGVLSVDVALQHN